MTRFLENQVALITGGSKGIGLAIAQRLLADGASVAICGRDAGALESARQSLASAHGEDRVAAFQADVSKLDDVRTLITSVKSRYGRLDILVNNAGLGIFKSVADLTPEEWHLTIDTNLSGVFYCCREAIPHLKESAHAFIVNVGSLAGRNTFAGGAAYNASKFGLLGFTEALMLDHRHDGIRVTCVMPGSVDTEFGHSGTGKPWKIQPEDIADTVAHVLALPERTLVSRVEVRPSRPPKA